MSGIWNDINVGYWRDPAGEADLRIGGEGA